MNGVVKVLTGVGGVISQGHRVVRNAQRVSSFPPLPGPRGRLGAPSSGPGSFAGPRTPRATRTPSTSTGSARNPRCKRHVRRCPPLCIFSPGRLPPSTVLVLLFTVCDLPPPAQHPPGNSLAHYRLLSTRKIDHSPLITVHLNTM